MFTHQFLLMPEYPIPLRGRDLSQRLQATIHLDTPVLTCITASPLPL